MQHDHTDPFRRTTSIPIEVRYVLPTANFPHHDVVAESLLLHFEGLVKAYYGLSENSKLREILCN